MSERNEEIITLEVSIQDRPVSHWVPALSYYRAFLTQVCNLKYGKADEEMEMTLIQIRCISHIDTRPKYSAMFTHNK